MYSGKIYPIYVTEFDLMAEELVTNVQDDHVTFEHNCNLRKDDIILEDDSDVSLRGILDTAFTSTVDSQDNGVFERGKCRQPSRNLSLVDFIALIVICFLVGEMAEDGLFSEGDIDNESALFHPSTSYDSGRRAERPYTASDSSFHESYFLDHNYVSDVPTTSANKLIR